MLEDELLALSPESPIAAERAAGLVRDSLGPELGVVCEQGAGWGERPGRGFTLAGGVATGTLYGAPGEGLLAPGEAYVAAIGAFDGLHLGHRALLARAAEEARALGCRLVAVTFSPDPSAVLSGARGEDLVPAEKRRLWIQAAGVEDVAVMDFTRELAGLTYGQFVTEVLYGLGDLRMIVVGSDFCLGRHGAGNVRALAELGASLGASDDGSTAGPGAGPSHGFSVVGMDLAGADGAAISATRIRGLLRDGRCEAAAGLLGRCYAVGGRVAHGRGEGTAFGFPTANVEVDPGLIMPQEGVYAGYVAVEGDVGAEAYPAAINVGRPPTFEPGAEGASFLEATLVGFKGDLYGRRAHVAFCRWLRASRPFDSREELERTVLGNIDWTRRALGGGAVRL